MNKRLYLVIIIFLFILFPVTSSPDPSVAITEYLLGTIDSNYIIMECISESFGTHGEWEETYSFVYRDKETNLETKRIFIKKQTVEVIDNKSPDNITIIEQTPDIQYLNLLELNLVREFTFKIEVISIKNNVIDFWGKYRDSEGGYTVDVEIPYDLETECFEVLNIFEDRESIYFKIRYSCWPSNDKYFSILKTEFEKHIIHAE